MKKTKANTTKNKNENVPENAREKTIEMDIGADILIRKYENRRLYSVNQKSYINLDDISTYINDGKKIKVVEVASDKDITCDILLQILLQQGKADLIPQEVLEIMVRMNNAWLRKFWSPYFDKSIRMIFELNPLLNGSTKDIFKNWFLK